MKRVKPEPVTVRGTCCIEGCNNLQASQGGGRYRAICQSHHENRTYGGRKGRTYRGFKKATCELCGFVPVHPCQLDVDHIDGNHANDAPENLQTLCANCHRLKTFQQLHA